MIVVPPYVAQQLTALKCGVQKYPFGSRDNDFGFECYFSHLFAVRLRISGACYVAILGASEMMASLRFASFETDWWMLLERDSPCTLIFSSVPAPQWPNWLSD